MTGYAVSENNYFTETCSGSDAGSYLRLIDFVYHSTLGLRVIKKEKYRRRALDCCQPARGQERYGGYLGANGT